MKEIKSYFFKGNEIIVKYNDKKIIKYELNKENIRTLINTLDKQIKFDINDVSKETDKEYDDLFTKALVGTFVQFVIIFALFLSFINGVMPIFIVTSLLSIAWFGFMVLKSYKELLNYMLLLKEARIYEGRKILINKYNSFDELENKEILNVC